MEEPLSIVSHPRTPFSIIFYLFWVPFLSSPQPLKFCQGHGHGKPAQDWHLAHFAVYLPGICSLRLIGGWSALAGSGRHFNRRITAIERKNHLIVATWTWNFNGFNGLREMLQLKPWFLLFTISMGCSVTFPLQFIEDSTELPFSIQENNPETYWLRGQTRLID